MMALPMCLAACMTAPSEIRVVAPAACPQVRAISQDDQTRIAAELTKLDQTSALWIPIKDDLKLRDEARACRSGPTEGRR